jgi:molybdopterin-containing oxidoreductase family membrane subunit
MMDRKMHAYSRYVGFAAFIWRLALTTGTGAIFGFLVARQAYGTALLAPMFIIMSFSFGLAVFMIAQAVMYRWNNLTLDEVILRRLKNLLAVFVAAVLYFTAVYHMTNLYFAKQLDFERFILLDGGIYTTLFWVGQVLIGGVLPLFLLFTAKKSSTVLIASALIILGGFFQLYVLLIGGQAFPLNLFPGMEASSSFFDGRIHPYSPSLPELLLGMGGIAAAALITVIAAKVLNFMPDDKHHLVSH